MGRIRSEELDEISGIVESRLTPGAFFVHNDSGDSPRFFAIDRAGTTLAELTLDQVPILIDAEDILSASPAMLAAGGGELQLEAVLVFGRGALPGSTMPTSASISRDGLSILIRTYSSVFLFRREPGESVADALGRPPRHLPSPAEQQGEAIGFAQADAAFITVSEGVNPTIHCAGLVE